MTTPLCLDVALGSVMVVAMSTLVFLISPFVALSFQAGLVVGLLLHTSHKSSTAAQSFVDQKT